MPNTTPDFRQLCTELLEHARVAQAVLQGEGLWDGDEDEGLFDRARAALAAEPQGPTDAELGDLLWEFTTSTGHGERLNAMGFVRAALARWGKQP